MGRGSSKAGARGRNAAGGNRPSEDELRARAQEIASEFINTTASASLTSEQGQELREGLIDRVAQELGVSREEADRLLGRSQQAYNSPTAETYNMSETALNVARRGGEGTFIRTDIPMLVRNDDGDGIEIRTEQGYATVVDGTPVFIQRARGGYHYNVYGMTASREPMRTLAEAKNVDNIRSRLTALSEANNTLEGAREIFNAANREGGISMDEYRRIYASQRQARRR